MYHMNLKRENLNLELCKIPNVSRQESLTVGFVFLNFSGLEERGLYIFEQTRMNGRFLCDVCTQEGPSLVLSTLVELEWTQPLCAVVDTLARNPPGLLVARAGHSVGGSESVKAVVIQLSQSPWSTELHAGHAWSQGSAAPVGS